jgi:AgrD protein
MKRGLLYKWSGALTAFAVLITTWSANTACTFVTHQPKLPETAKKLRKF